MMISELANRGNLSLYRYGNPVLSLRNKKSQTTIPLAVKFSNRSRAK